MDIKCRCRIPQFRPENAGPAAVIRKILIVIGAVIIPPVLIVIVTATGVMSETLFVKPDPAESSAFPSIFSARKIKPAETGFILYDPETGKTIQNYNSDKTFIPASTSKIAVAAAAIEVLGADYRFQTEVLKTGRVSGGVLTGDLFLKGGGDPFLKVEDLMIMIQTIRKSGIRSVKGGFFYDEGLTGYPQEIDPGMDVDAVYNPGIGLLSLDSNTIRAYWIMDKSAGLVSSYFVPQLPDRSLKVEKKKFKEGVKFNFSSTDDSEMWIISNGSSRRGSARLPVKNPGRYTANLFSKLCAVNGIVIGRPEKGPVNPGASRIAVHKSEPLGKLVDIMLEYSNNIMAELIMLKTAEKISGQPPGLEKSAGIIADYFKKQISGPDWTGFVMKRGSGLTSSNRITPRQMLALLLYSSSRVNDEKPFEQRLPLSGWSWSMGHRLFSPDNAFRVNGKPGSINYAVSLAGYLTARSGKRLVFAVFFTDPARRLQYESDPDKRSRRSLKPVYRWMDSRVEAIDELVAGWIDKY